MTSESLSHLQEVWEAQARADPLWAILSEDTRRRRGWDVPTFLATGERFVADVLERFVALGHEPSGTALDFGCGVGRLSQPLARRFDRVTGVDISPTMVAAAQRLNQFGDRVSYIVNATSDLAFVPSASVDLVMSFITLQHIPPDAARSYLAEFVRILRPGGLLFFQMPSHRNAELVDEGIGERPIAPENCRAVLAVETPPVSLTSRQVVQIDVSVRNDSDTTWVSIPRHPLRLANHWFDEHGKTVVHDDGRIGLPSRVAAGDSVTLRLTVTAPEVPGSYGLVLDVVQEGVRWFGDVGNPPLVLPLQILSPSAEPQDESPSEAEIFEGVISAEWSEPPAFSMHGIERPELECLLEMLGAAVLMTDEHVDDWVSFGYYVVRSAHG